MATIFSRIAKGEIPSYKIAEDDRFFAFLDIRPVERGHTLVIPKQEVDYLYDLDDETLSGLFLFSRRVARAIEAVVPCKRIGVAVIGLEVPHAHVHLIPLITASVIDFSQKVEMTPDALAALAANIAAAFK